MAFRNHPGFRVVRIPDDPALSVEAARRRQTATFRSRTVKRTPAMYQDGPGRSLRKYMEAIDQAIGETDRISIATTTPARMPYGLKVGV